MRRKTILPTPLFFLFFFFWGEGRHDPIQKSQSSIALTKSLKGKSRIRNREPKLFNPDRGHYENEVVGRRHPTRQGVFFFFWEPLPPQRGGGGSRKRSKMPEQLEHGSMLSNNERGICSADYEKAKTGR